MAQVGAQLASFFQTPGANLLPAEKIIFGAGAQSEHLHTITKLKFRFLPAPPPRPTEEIKAIVDRATDPLLLRSDWESNIRCSDLVNQQLSSEIIGQVVFLLRRKLQSRQPKQAYLTIALVESLVKNCGTRLHAGINNEAFMQEMCRVARRYVRLDGPDNLEVCEACLDVLQAWGEAFLPRQRQFPNIVKAYQDLRVEGLPFRKQYDPTRVPIFTPAGPGGDETDIILAAAIASAAVQDEREVAGGGGQRGSNDLRASLSGTVFEPLCASVGQWGRFCIWRHLNRPFSSSFFISSYLLMLPPASLLLTLNSTRRPLPFPSTPPSRTRCAGLLRDLLLHAATVQDVQQSDLVPELVLQV